MGTGHRQESTGRAPPAGRRRAVVSPPMRRRRPLVLVGIVLVVVLAGCRHDGRDLAAESPTGTQTIIPSTTVDPGSVVAEDNANGDLDLETLPGEDLEGDTGGIIQEDYTMSIALPFGQGEPIDARYTCDGEDTAPSVDWFDLPEGTVQVAIEVTDLQAPDFVHWIITGLDPAIGHLEDGEVPVGAIQATNSNGDIGYTGPCPPPGATHTYVVQLSALDQRIELPDGADAEALRQAIGAATIESVSETGTVVG